VVELPGAQPRGEALPILLDLVDRGIVRIPDGPVVVLEISDLDGDGVLDVEVLHGASSGVLGRDDIEQAAALVEPGKAAGILVYENLWAAPFVAALHRAGGALVAAGPIPMDDLSAALDDTEPVEARVSTTDRGRTTGCPVCFGAWPARRWSQAPQPRSRTACHDARRAAGRRDQQDQLAQQALYAQPEAEAPPPATMDDKLAQLK